MVTKVGLQSQFSDAMKELLELEYETLESYDVAISKIMKKSYRETLLRFADDHIRHIDEIAGILDAHNEEVPNGPGGRQWLTKGKVMVAALIGDKAILSALHSNEADTSAAYKRMNTRQDMWEDASTTVQRGLEDIKKHNTWLAKA